ncbi:MAG: alpha/beta hydrolase [Lachnospiraceae bacterium]|nr:alpha/beta hydrolase [Lachnospiraceae bacterium]
MYIQLDSQVLYYKKTGSGRPLLMLHGNGESHEIFDALSDDLEGDFTMYLPDTRGCGLSSPSGNGQYHYEDMAGDMRKLLDAIDVRSCDIFGFSDGAVIAMLLAIEFPERVRRMILCGANLSPAGLKFMAKRKIKAEYRKTKNDMIAMMLREPNLTADDLAKIKAPTLVCAGEKDLIKEAETRQIAHGIPDAKLFIVPGEDHASYVINSTRMAPSIRKFLR